MQYSIIQPPFTLKFREMSKQELKDYYQWFREIIPERVTELARAVRSASEFENWQPDCTPESLDVLGRWFSGQIETRTRADQELQEIKGRSAFAVEVPGEELSNRSFSLAMDIGMYFSQVLLKNNPSLKWEQPFGNKQFVDYGQPVLVKFGPAPFNPVRMMVTLAYGLASKKKTGEALKDIYAIWARLVHPSS
jgi:hypothetical protein